LKNYHRNGISNLRKRKNDLSNIGPEMGLIEKKPGKNQVKKNYGRKIVRDPLNIE
jgi:hypothetical protein